MYSIIASSFFQKKTCILPGIGRLDLVTRNAEADFTNKQIKAPVQEIEFTPSSSNERLFNEFSAISELIKEKLDATGEVELAGIGVFTKKSSGNIQFDAIQPDAALVQPVTAIRVIRENSEHALLVGDRETTNTQMNEIAEEGTPLKGKWWFWAILLGAIGLALLAIYIYQHQINNFANEGLIFL